jgi:phosphate ABC transporter phosphate-binding protein
MASREKSIVKNLRPFWLLIGVLLLVTACPSPAEAAQDLSQVKKLYVAPISGETGANELRASLLKQLNKTGQFQLVDSPEQADAVLKGTGQLWVTGYIYVNPRAPTSKRQAVYSGFLSVELVGHNNQVLWSYLVTPAKFSSSSVPDDLSGNLVKRLIAARSKKTGQEPAAAGSEHLEPTTLHGGGATLPAPLYLKWFESFEGKNPAIQVQYDSVGSETGIRLLTEGKVDFAGSDVPPDTSALQISFLRVPTVLGGVVPIYNLKNVGSNLKFTPEMLAGIYLAKITKWNDPLIHAANKGIPLPDAEIAVIHRSDGSGTTYTWSDFLSKTSTVWKSTVGTGMTVAWPTGTGAEHNDGVATLVQKTPNSIGYVELVYAIQHQLSFGSVRNAAGEFIHADLETLAAAAKDSLGSGSELPASITNSPGKGAYPIATFTWLLLPEESSDQAKKAALVGLLRWVLTDGQKESSALGYAPLPHSLADWALRSLSKLR